MPMVKLMRQCGATAAVLNLLRLADHCVNFVSVRGPPRPAEQQFSNLPSKICFSIYPPKFQISNFQMTFFEVNFTKDLHPSSSSDISENLRRNRKNSQPADHQAGRLSPQIENRCATDVCHPRSHLHNC